MHSNEPEVAQSENQDGEIISSLRLAGFRGGVRTVVLPERLLFEHASGDYLRMGYDKISRMRHHQFPLIPNWTAMIAFLGIYASLRVLSGPLQLWIGLFAATALVAWLAIRLPALTIDAADDGCYTVFGPEYQLLKLRLVIERLQDGTTFDEAFEGLDELVHTQFPSSGVFSEVLAGISQKNPNDTQLDAAMNELISAEKVDSDTVGVLAVNSDDSEPLQILDMDPMVHGSVVRARQIKQEMKTTPQHEGWANVAQRVEPLSIDERQPSMTWDNPISEEKEYPSFQEPIHTYQRPTTPPSGIFENKQEEPSALDAMFGFNLEEVETTEIQPQGFFSDLSPEKNSVGDWLPTGKSESDYPTTFTTQHATEQDSWLAPTPTINEQSHNFINSFQTTGGAVPPNRIDAHVHGRSTVTTEPESPMLGSFSSGVVSRAKRSEGENETLDAEIVECESTAELKRIQRTGERKFRRLNPVNNQRRNLRLRDVIAPVWKIRIPDALRSSRRSKEEANATPPPPHGRTLDALRIQAQQTHEAQIANALRGLTGIATEKQIADLLLEDVAPELITEEIPLNFDQMTSTSKSTGSVCLPGVERLD